MNNAPARARPRWIRSPSAGDIFESSCSAPDCLNHHEARYQAAPTPGPVSHHDMNGLAPDSAAAGSAAGMQRAAAVLRGRRGDSSELVSPHLRAAGLPHSHSDGAITRRVYQHRRRSMVRDTTNATHATPYHDTLPLYHRNGRDLNTTQRNATERNAAQRNATQRSATQRNATYRSAARRDATRRNETQRNAVVYHRHVCHFIR